MGWSGWVVAGWLVAGGWVAVGKDIGFDFSLLPSLPMVFRDGFIFHETIRRARGRPGTRHSGGTRQEPRDNLKGIGAARYQALWRDTAGTTRQSEGHGGDQIPSTLAGHGGNHETI